MRFLENILKHLCVIIFPFACPPTTSGFHGSDGEQSACNAEDLSSVPGGRFPREGNGYPFKYFCLENSMDRGAYGLQSMGSQRVKHD